MDVQTAVISEASKLNGERIIVDRAESNGVIYVNGKEVHCGQEEDPVLALLSAVDGKKAAAIIKQREADAVAEKEVKIAALKKQSAALAAEAKKLEAQK